MEPSETTPGNDSAEQIPYAKPIDVDNIPAAVSEWDWKAWKRFFQFTGGSILYCLSAVFVAYGIVRVIGTMLSEEGHTIGEALPCIFTLGGYELALLSVLILIVSRKVVDDAVSLTVLIALFLVGTSLALGTVADLGVKVGFYIGIGGIVLAFVKFFAMRRYAGIPFGRLCLAGLGIVMTGNYMGPIWLAKLVATDPSRESIRREIWLLMWLVLLIGCAFAWFELSGRQRSPEAKSKKGEVFLQTPRMTYVFFLILLAASGVQQYSMSYMLAMKRVLGDYIPMILAMSVYSIEMLRYFGKRFGTLETVISCVPLGAMCLALYKKSVLAHGVWGMELLFYPPVVFAAGGILLGLLAVYRKQHRLLTVAYLYGLGVLLTAGYQPEQPYVLQIKSCAGILTGSMVLYGIFRRNEFYCLAGILFLCVGLYHWEAFAQFAADLQLKKPGGLAGVFGLGMVFVTFIFWKDSRRIFRILGTAGTAIFLYDLLPAYLDIRYLIVLAGVICILAGFWKQARDLAAMVLICIPYAVRAYAASKQIASWRYVIAGFILLGCGALFSLLKRIPQEIPCTEEDKTD